MHSGAQSVVYSRLDGSRQVHFLHLPVYGAWTGSVSTDWFDANNWTGGVPTAKTLNLNAGGQLNQSGATLDLKGAFITNRNSQRLTSFDATAML